MVLRRRLLVLVLHPRGRRRRRQLALPPRDGGPLRRVAARERDASGVLWAACGGGVLLGACSGSHHRDRPCSSAAVPWSKFAHMFFKPAAAFEKRVSRANGTAENLPTQTRDDPEQQKRHSMELLRDAPMDMGLGIKREAPRHY